MTWGLGRGDRGAITTWPKSQDEKLMAHFALHILERLQVHPEKTLGSIFF